MCTVYQIVRLTSYIKFFLSKVWINKTSPHSPVYWMYIFIRVTINIKFTAEKTETNKPEYTLNSRFSKRFTCFSKVLQKIYVFLFLFLSKRTCVFNLSWRQKDVNANLWLKRPVQIIEHPFDEGDGIVSQISASPSFKTSAISKLGSIHKHQVYVTTIATKHLHCYRCIQPLVRKHYVT